MPVPTSPVAPPSPSFRKSRRDKSFVFAESLIAVSSPEKFGFIRAPYPCRSSRPMAASSRVSCTARRNVRTDPMRTTPAPPIPSRACSTTPRSAQEHNPCGDAKPGGLRFSRKCHAELALDDFVHRWSPAFDYLTGATKISCASSVPMFTSFLPTRKRIGPLNGARSSTVKVTSGRKPSSAR